MTSLPPEDDPEATMYAAPAARKAFVRSALQGDAAARGAEDKPLQLDELAGLNPLVSAANPLLTLVPQLRSSVSYPDPVGLRDNLLREIASFERNAQAAGVAREFIAAGRYALCTLLDESISFTPWGGSGQWSRNSLLVTLFQEAWGGEKFFLLLGKLAEDAAKNLHVLELLYVCLALGFEGRYRVVDGGRAQLDDVRERLYQMIKKQRGQAETALSPNWQGVRVSTRRGVRFLWLWVTLSVAALVLGATFFAMTYALNARSDDVFRTLASIKAPLVQVPVAPVQNKVEPVRLRKLLGREIAAGQVQVQEDDTSSLVTILGDNLFEKGSTEIAPAYQHVIGQIAIALNSVPGTVIVRGHTDSTPIHTPRFPSNWHLSQERAASVAQLMSQTLTDPKRVKIEGLADSSPLVPNDTPANQAKNRRVEILLKAAPQ